jgi:transcriptional regulator with XRE-family HTH domain
MPDPAELQVLVDLRKAARLSQARVAELFGLTPEQGRKTIGNWEAGVHPADKHRRTRFIRYLWDDLGLRREPAQFEAIWSILVEAWRWEPINDAE